MTLLQTNFAHLIKDFVSLKDIEDAIIVISQIEEKIQV